jgi:hypothetical protein
MTDEWGELWQGPSRTVQQTSGFGFVGWGCGGGEQGVCQSGNDAPLTPTILSQCIFYLPFNACKQERA